MHSPEHEGTEEGGDDSMTQLLILVVTPFRIEPSESSCVWGMAASYW